MSQRPEHSWLDQPIVKGVGLTREQGLYLLIIAACLVSRLAMLGFHVQSHDESLHTKYSWNLYAGQGFQHAPVYHGPFLFHATALSYALFGDTDFTARLPVALMGTLLVAFPYLLRRQIGRKGALAASALLLISPSITYYSRYIRHDIPVILWAMISIWSIFRLSSSTSMVVCPNFSRRPAISLSRKSLGCFFRDSAPADRNASRHLVKRAAVTPNSRESSSMSSPRSRRSTISVFSLAEKR